MASPEGRPIQITLGLVPDLLPAPLTDQELRRQDFKLVVQDRFGGKSKFGRGRNNVDRIMDAYDDAVFAHRDDDPRASGEEYITHPLGAAYILINECGLKGNDGADLVIAALLHDVLEDTDYIVPRSLVHEMGSSAWRDKAAGKIIKRYGKKVASYILPLSKPVVEGMEVSSKEEANRKAMEALTSAPTIILKMADRLHNARTLKFLSAERQNKIIQETAGPFRKIFEKAKGKLPFGKAYDILAEQLDIAIKTTALVLDSGGKLDPETKSILEAANIHLNPASQTLHLA